MSQVVIDMESAISDKIKQREAELEAKANNAMEAWQRYFVREELNHAYWNMEITQTFLVRMMQQLSEGPGVL